MATVGQWVQGARPRTLGAAVSPVAAGTGAAAAAGGAKLLPALLALVVAVALQIAVNYANDYSDGVRGTDADRVGPVRLVGQGLAAPAAVRTAALAAFLAAAVAGLALIVITGTWWLLLVGAAAIAAAWLYTGGPRPYGYFGLGELFVFIFFGIVPVAGTEYVQVGTVSTAGWAISVGVGALACAVLVANNLRDIPTDAGAGKRTLAVRIGDRATRSLYLALLVAAFVVVGVVAAPALVNEQGAWLALVSLPLAVRPALDVARGALGRELIPVLQWTGLLTLSYGVLMGIGLALW